MDGPHKARPVPHLFSSQVPLSQALANLVRSSFRTIVVRERPTMQHPTAEIPICNSKKARSRGEAAEASS
ncbi:MAG TPA: hypothetical protein VGB92_22300, partial [Longimicrobium sp.]